MKESKGVKSVKVSRETKKMYIICICCILVAMIGRLVSKQSLDFSSNAIVCVALSAAAFIWMIQVKNRVIHPEERKYMVWTGVMIVFLLVIRTIKYNYLLEGSTEERYLWTSWLLFLVLFFLSQGFSDICSQILNGWGDNPLSLWIGAVPGILYDLILIVAAGMEMYLFFIVWKKKRQKISIDAMRKSIDYLPDEICFF